MLRSAVKIQSLSPLAAPVCGKIHAQSFTGAECWEAEFFARLFLLPTTRGLLALDDGTPVGFMVWQHDEDGAEILTLAVTPEVRQRGTGRALVREFERTLREEYIPRALLDVAEDNTAARRLYDREGYKTIRIRADYYTREDSTKVDALVMEKVFLNK